MAYCALFGLMNGGFSSMRHGLAHLVNIYTLRDEYINYTY